MTAVQIVQLYPEELGVAGDRGNTLAVAARLDAAGIAQETVLHRRGDQLPSSADIVIIGGGPLSAMRTVYTDLIANGGRLRAWATAGVPIFAYGSGAELLGHSITLLPGQGTGDQQPMLDGIGIFPFRARRVRERTVGYVITDTAWGRLVGFEDNASRWELDADARPVGTVVTGDGNGDGREGVLVESSIATQIGGPVLPLNPALADVLVSSAARRLGIEVPSHQPTDIDEYARKARDVITMHAAHVFSRI